MASKVLSTTASCAHESLDDLQCFNCQIKQSQTDTKILKCSKCHFATYCSVDCQKKDWPNHKNVCNIAKLLETYKTPKDFSKGTILSEDYWEEHAKTHQQDAATTLADLANSGRLDVFKAKRSLLDIGSGYDLSIFPFLQAGWEVTCVDTSNEVLKMVNAKADELDKSYLKNKKLLTYDQDVTKFNLGKRRFQVIVAENILPYIHPYKFLNLWNDIYESLDETGYLIGNFVTIDDHNDERLKPYVSLGVWLIKDIKSAQELLKQKYSIVTFETHKLSDLEPEDPDLIFIEFVVQKKKVS
jgi:SAM-dependent methyltransferase